MKLSQHAIDRPRVVLVAAALLICLALMAGVTIPVQRTPAITKAVVLVIVPYPGAQPTEVEEQITREIEDALTKINDVDFIASTSMRGSSITQVVFLDGVDAETARGEVKDLVDEIRRELPVAREVQPIVTDIDFENTPLMLVNLSGPPGFDQRSLKAIAEEVQQELEAVPGVSNTQLFGGREREIHVNVNVDLATQYGLTISDFRKAAAGFHSEIPAGALDTGEIDHQVRSETVFRGVDDIREAILRHDEGRIIRIGDVADVRDTYRRLKNVAFLDGGDCATIIVNKDADINTLAAARALRAKVAGLRQQYPNVKFSMTRDTSEDISLMFRVLGSSFVFGAMLVLVILGWAMGLRVSILVLSAIPFSTAVALVFLYFFDIPLSNMVIFSFILVLGMVVDGAIIVAENIHRHWERGEDPVTAAKLGIDEVGTPVIVADLTTVAAYLPMLLVPGIMGDFMGVMPKVVSVALLGSVLVDHFLLPVVAARWYRRRRMPPATRSPGGPATAGSAASHLPHRLSLPVRIYAVILRWALNHRWAVVASTVLGLFWAGFMLGHVGFEFFPESDRGQFEIKYELPLGNSIEQTIAAGEIIAEPLRELQERGDLVHFVSAIGSSEGLASRLETDPAVGPEFGTILVQLLSPLDRDRHERDIIRHLRRQIDSRLDEFPGMTYSINEVQEGPPGGADVAVRLTGDDLDLLGDTAELIADRLRQIPDTVDVQTDYRAESPEIVVEPNPAVVGLFDMTEAQVSQALQTVVNGDTRIELTIDDEDVTLRLQAAPEYQQTKEALERLMLTSATGRKATIGQLAALRRTSALYAVNRYEKSRAVVARCDLVNRTTPDDVFGKLRDEILPDLGFRQIEASEATGFSKIVYEEILPVLGYKTEEMNIVRFVGRPGSPIEGVRATFTGENEERDKNFSYLQRSMIIAVVLIFGILVIQFNSFRQAVIVLLAVPLSFIGVVAGMWICRFPFSLASFIGLVALTGVVVNDAIVVVDFINKGRRRGLPLRDAIVESGIHRFRPVLLTTLTTIGGLLPLFGNWTGGAEFWQPLTGAIIFGLGFATVLTLVVIPVGYSLAYPLLDRRAGPRMMDTAG
jgi:multidrug efflux pump subunit AcrB